MLAQVTSHAEHQKQTQREQESFFFFFFLQLLSCTSVNLKGITYSCNKNDCIQIAWFGKTAYKSSHEKRHLNSIWIFMGFYLIQCLFCLEKNSQRKKQKHLNMGGTHAVLKGNRLCFLTAMKLCLYSSSSIHCIYWENTVLWLSLPLQCFDPSHLL